MSTKISILLAVTAVNAQPFHIPPQSLSGALNDYAETANVQLSYPASQTSGLMSDGIDGEYSPQQALHKLLDGTGLKAETTTNGTITLSGQGGLMTVAETSPPPDTIGSEQTMPKVTVEADAEVEADPYDPTDTVNPYNRSYRVTNSSVATKTDTSNMDTPSAIQIIPQQVMKDQQVIRLEDALKNISSVSREFSYGGANIYDSFMLRGFRSQSGIYRNGIRLIEQAYETTNLQQIEVLKGPASVLYGRLEPGGLVNITTKKPLATPYYALEQQIGSYDLYRTTIDATGPVTDDKSLLYRVNLAYSDHNTFRDFSGKERFFIAPSLSWKPNDRFDLNVNFEYRNDTFRSDLGVPVLGNRPAPVPISFSINEKNLEEGLETYTAGMDWTYRFNDDWKVTNRFLFNRAEYDWNDLWQGGIYSDPDSGRLVVDRSFLIRGPGLSDTFTTNFDINGKFDTFGAKHNVLVGFDFYQRERADLDNVWDVLPPSQVPPLDLFNPVHGQVNIPNNLTANTFWKANTDWYGVYFQDQITLWDKLHIMLGGRYDSARTESAFAGTLADLKFNPNDVEAWNPRAGIVYQPWTWLSIYGNYVQSLGVDNERGGAGGGSLAPEKGEQFEAGIKGEFLDGKLTSSLAFYHINKSNLKTPDLSTPLDPFDSRAIGKARSRGVEFDISGRLTERWAVIGSYAYTDARVIQDIGQVFDAEGNVIGSNKGNTGSRLVNVPEHSASMWTTYDIMPEFTLGTGVYMAGQREGDLANTYQLPGYVRWDMMAAYRFNIGKTRLTTQLNVNNILDKQYYLSSAQNPNQILPADPLSFIGSVKLEY